MKNAYAMQQFKKAYQDDAFEVAVYGASPVGLVIMLYEGAIKAIRQAKVAMNEQNYVVKGVMINKATDIIEGLRVALDHTHNRPLSVNLEELYIYLKFRLGVANMKNEVEILDEAIHLLEIILPAWQEVASRPEAAMPQSENPAGQLRASGA